MTYGVRARDALVGGEGLVLWYITPRAEARLPEAPWKGLALWTAVWRTPSSESSSGTVRCEIRGVAGVPGSRRRNVIEPPAGGVSLGDDGRPVEAGLLAVRDGGGHTLRESSICQVVPASRAARSHAIVCPTCRGTCMQACAHVTPEGARRAAVAAVPGRNRHTVGWHKTRPPWRHFSAGHAACELDERNHEQ